MTLSGNRLLKAGIVSFAFALAVLSCSNIAEQEIIYDAGLHIISPETMEITASIPGVKNASCLMIYPGKIFMASTEGIVRCYDSEGLTLLGEYIVGLGSPAAYTQMVYSPAENTAYLIGPLGQIIELSMPECEILDVFSVGQAPVDLTVTSGFPGDLWVADGPGNSIDRVELESNKSVHTIHLSSYTVINDIQASGHFPDSLLVATSYGIYKAEALQEGDIRWTPLLGMGGNYDALCSIPHDSNFVVVSGGNIMGELCAYDDSVYAEAPSRFYNTSPIDGSNWITAAGNDYINMYALGSRGDGTCILYRYTYIGPSYGITGYTCFNGYPVDLKISGTGQIYLLTIEQ